MTILSRTLLLISLSFILDSCSPDQGAQAVEQYNVLFIAIDDLRPELGCYGAGYIHSPNIDRLASQSALFERAYCNVPVCGASRASLLSGMRPTRNRFLHYHDRLDQMAPDALSLPGHFKQNGYTTHSYGKIFHHQDDDSASWDVNWRLHEPNNGRHYADSGNIEIAAEFKGWKGPSHENPVVSDTAYKDGVLASKAINALQNFMDSDKPFFLAVGFWKPHLPFNAPKKYWDLYNREDLEVPDGGFRPGNAPEIAFHNSGELRNYTNIPKENEPLNDSIARDLIHGYAACVSFVDAQVGKVLEQLDQLGLSDNTIVVLWGDHGYNLREHGMWCKHCSFETSLHAPLIIKKPGEAPVRVNDVVEFVDIYPSLCELTGISLPAHLQGNSLVPVIKGEGHTDGLAISKWYDATTLIADRYFYTEWKNDNDSAYAAMLYDHEEDAHEMHNLLSGKKHDNLRDSLHVLLDQNLPEDFWE